MKKMMMTLCMAMALPTTMLAQMDDMYWMPSKKTVKATRPSRQHAAAPTVYSGSNRDVDEYNRMAGEEGYYNGDDSVDMNTDYQLTRKMARFDDYTPDEAFWKGYSEGVSDARDNYFWHSPWYFSSYYPWYDSWGYSWRYGWYDPWYYDYWYRPGYAWSFGFGWGWGGWRYSYGWGWNSWAWHRPYYGGYYYGGYHGGGHWHNNWAYNSNHRPVAGSRNHGYVPRHADTPTAIRNGRSTRVAGGTFSNGSNIGRNGTRSTVGTRSGQSGSSATTPTGAGRGHRGTSVGTRSSSSNNSSSGNYSNSNASRQTGTFSNGSSNAARSSGGFSAGGSSSRGSSMGGGGGASRSGGGGGASRGHR